MTSTESTPYKPKDALAETVKMTLISGGMGLFASSVQNTLEKRNVGPWGVFTRTGGTIAIFASVGGAYTFAKNASANLREKEDHWNTAVGGFFGGAIFGLRSRTFPAVIGFGVVASSILGAFDYTGGSLSGPPIQREMDEYDRREKLRTNYRTPVEQTVAELGEGRGIYGPGYAERRRQRIKENYGIDVPVSQPPAS